MTYTDNQVAELIYASCFVLDEEEYDSYMQLFTESMRYRVVTYSPELRKDMVWLDHDAGEMRQLLKMLPQHVKIQGRFFRQAVVYQARNEDQIWNTVTSVTLTHTDPNGTSKLLAAGRYYDEIVENNGQLLIDKREVRLETRDLGPGMHVPL